MSEKHRLVKTMATKGFSQKEIATLVGVHQSTVSRILNNPTEKEAEDFYENSAYGAYTTNTGERIVFNRRYRPLSDKSRWVENIASKEWFYNDRTSWKDRFHQSSKQKVIFKA